MNALMAKMKAAGSIKETALLSDSILFNEKDSIPTEIPIINLALSGKFKEGLVSGLTFLAGPSKHFKSLLGLMMVKAYMTKYPDSICLFFDSEFGITPDYIKANGLDASRILHIPILHVEQLKFDLVKRVSEIKRTDKVIIFVDSIGNLASKKEVEDAEKENEAADMSRAKALKSLWRIITPHLTIKDIPLIAINHTYQTQEKYSKAIMSGGCLLAGTELIMSDGTKRSIETIQVGDSVLTTIGDRLVTDIWDPETLEVGYPECFEIEFEDGSKVICSDKHKFRINGQWVEAKDLIAGDNLETHST